MACYLTMSERENSDKRSFLFNLALDALDLAQTTLFVLLRAARESAVDFLRRWLATLRACARGWRRRFVGGCWITGV